MFRKSLTYPDFNAWLFGHNSISRPMLRFQLPKPVIKTPSKRTVVFVINFIVSHQISRAERRKRSTRSERSSSHSRTRNRPHRRRRCRTPTKGTKHYTGFQNLFRHTNSIFSLQALIISHFLLLSNQNYYHPIQNHGYYLVNHCIVHDLLLYPY